MRQLTEEQIRILTEPEVDDRPTTLDDHMKWLLHDIQTVQDKAKQEYTKDSNQENLARLAALIDAKRIIKDFVENGNPTL